MNKRITCPAKMLISLLMLTSGAISTHGAPTQLIDTPPARISLVEPGVYLVDFGRVAFGNLRLLPPSGATGSVTVHFGEALKDGRIDRSPPGTVRYNRAQVRLEAPVVVAAPPPDIRNTWQPGKTDFSKITGKPFAPRNPPPPAILTPEEWGVILPFRWVEIEGWPGQLLPGHLTRQAAFAAAWDDEDARFQSSDDMLNRVWDLCRYSIKATTFAGVYVDGDRERIPYEADAYLNQLSHYATSRDVTMARDTFDHLIEYPTWPTEWASHMVFMAYADWWHTGDLDWLEKRFDLLKPKLLLDRMGSDGLIESTQKHIEKGDIVDWPKGERDGFVFTRVNTVVNAFFLRALERMVTMAEALGRTEEAARYAELHRTGCEAFHRILFDPKTGLYRDGVGTEHTSLHANLFALAFDIAPPAVRPRIATWLASRDMACSVYVAQYFMETLFQQGFDGRALDLMLAHNDRSWRHMVENGTTITWEAWDLKYKANLDWNHAWGAAPANLLPRFVLGVRANAPGWTEALVAPQPGGLSSASGRVPTPKGYIEVSWTFDDTFDLSLKLPEGIPARVTIPAAGKRSGVFIGDTEIAATLDGDRWHLDQPVHGSTTLSAR